MKPIVAIVGPPNVGKSTLFNRLAKRKRAIVANEPGTTIDRNYADVDWHGLSLTIVDTGGFEPNPEREIMAQMKEQTLLAIEEAEAVIHLADGRTGVTPADRQIHSLLRRSNKPVFLAVNKIDGPKLSSLAAEFYELGIDHIYPISALHGHGIYELMDDVTSSIKGQKAPSTLADEPRDDEIRLAVIGRPNVGKSSLINRILGQNRVIVNPEPGTTRDAIDTPFTYQGRRYLLIDTAGIRRKSRISLTLEKYSVMSALKTIDRCDIALVIIDAVEGITEQDVKIAGLAHEEGKACIMVVNKWDAISKDNSTVGRYVESIRNKAKFLDFAPIIFVSALSGQRVSKIFPLVEHVFTEYCRRIPTAEVNRVCREIIEQHPPPRINSRENAITFMTQVGIKPPTFVFFVRKPEDIHFSYERFLENRLREAFGFSSVPVKILFRKKSRK
ncbi:MAG: ribosome biogenesis GTPase Der [Syntrophales bacterium]|nr:ribosome biogenesis GTPase Der [Syntrophales bacterium]